MLNSKDELQFAQNWERIKEIHWHYIPDSQLFIDEQDQVFVTRLLSEDAILGLGYLHYANCAENDTYPLVSKGITEFVNDIEAICKRYSDKYIIAIVKNFKLFQVKRSEILRIPQHVKYYYMPKLFTSEVKDERHLVFEDLNVEFFRDR
jgi:hypothetical protein